jgi:hypothetical protein
VTGFDESVSPSITRQSAVGSRQPLFFCHPYPILAKIHFQVAFGFFEKQILHVATATMMMMAAMESSETTNTTVDEDLSQLTASTLTISQTKEITECSDIDFQLPKKLHAGLYEYKFEHEYQQRKRTLMLADSSTRDGSEEGVPGFPDFPDCWCGEEGWAVWEKTATKENETRKKAWRRNKATTRRMRLQRPAVNVVGLRKSSSSAAGAAAGFETKPSKPKAHKAARRRKMLQQLPHKRQMIALQKSLKSLSCA